MNAYNVIREGLCGISNRASPSNKLHCNFVFLVAKLLLAFCSRCAAIQSSNTRKREHFVQFRLVPTKTRFRLVPTKKKTEQ